MEKFENEQTLIERSDEEEFQRYVEDLELRPEDFDKKILDVGSGAAQFAKWAKENGVSQKIYSLDSQKDYFQEKDNNVAAVAENMPFGNEAFDLVVSDAAIPNIYIHEENLESIKDKVVSSLSEMLRVIKPGGEIRLARVLLGKEYESQKVLSSEVESALGDLENQGHVRIEKMRTPLNDTYEYEGDKPKKLLAEAYLIVIHKQK